MTAGAPFAYAQARIQARLASRADEALWAKLEASRSLGHYLERARATGLEPWTASIDPSATTHDIERTLRALFRSHASQIAGWVPERWQESIRWVARLIDVPLVEATATRVWQDEELEHAQIDLGTNDSAHPPIEVWLARFRALWPPVMPARRRALEALIGMLGRHRRALLEAERSGAELDTAARRRQLAYDLNRFLRRHPEQPAAVFAHLALVALDLERLRAALVARALFPSNGEATWA